MGVFHLACDVQELTREKPAMTVEDVMVDSGAEYTWLPEGALCEAGITVAKKDVPFVLANGQEVTRDVGYAFLFCGEFETVDEA